MAEKPLLLNDDRDDEPIEEQFQRIKLWLESVPRFQIGYNIIYSCQIIQDSRGILLEIQRASTDSNTKTVTTN